MSVAQVDGFEIRSIKDVRALGRCSVCSQIGMRGQGLLLIRFKRDKRDRIYNKVFAHPSCLSETELLGVDNDELRTVRICDVEPLTLGAILSKLQESRRDTGHGS